MKLSMAIFELTVCYTVEKNIFPVNYFALGVAHNISSKYKGRTLKKTKVSKMQPCKSIIFSEFLSQKSEKLG